MNLQQLQVLASYWGNNCSYKSTHISGTEYPKLVDVDDAALIGYVLDKITLGKITDFRLHLRSIDSITEDEAKEVREILGIAYDEDVAKYLLLFWDRWDTAATGKRWNKAINKLKQLGIYCGESCIKDYVIIKG